MSKQPRPGAGAGPARTTQSRTTTRPAPPQKAPARVPPPPVARPKPATKPKPACNVCKTANPKNPVLIHPDPSTKPKKTAVVCDTCIKPSDKRAKSIKCKACNTPLPAGKCHAKHLEKHCGAVKVKCAHCPKRVPRDQLAAHNEDPEDCTPACPYCHSPDLSPTHPCITNIVSQLIEATRRTSTTFTPADPDEAVLASLL